MLTTQTLVSRASKQVKTRLGKDSVSQLARDLSVSRATINRWKEGKTMEDSNAVNIAVFLDLNPDYVLACIAGERNRGTPEYQSWARIAASVKVANLPRKSAA